VLLGNDVRGLHNRLCDLGTGVPHCSSYGSEAFVRHISR
jgi:hypothetical protein